MDGVGVDETVDNEDGTFTIHYTDGSFFTTSDLTGPQGPPGEDGLADGSAVGNTPYWDGDQWVTDCQNIFNAGEYVGVNTDHPEAQLHVFGKSGLMVSGMYGQDIDFRLPPPMKTKMFFIPETGIFRVGKKEDPYLPKTIMGEFSVGWGDQIEASGHGSTAWGNNTKATGGNSTVWGFGSEASGGYSTAWGNNSISGAIHSTAWGLQSSALANYSTAWGNYSVATGMFSTAWGEETDASGESATAWGLTTTAPSAYETALGAYNTTYTPVSASEWNDDDRLFSVGRGTSSTNRLDAMVVMKNGNVGIGTSDPQSRLEVRTTGNRSLKFSYIQLGLFPNWSWHPSFRPNFDNDGFLGTSGYKFLRAYVNTYYGVNTSIQAISDASLKKNITPLGEGMEQIMLLNPVRYDLNAKRLYPDPESRKNIPESDLVNQMGLVAQEVQQLFPELVKPMDHESGILTLGYSGLIPVMIKGMQEQQETIQRQNAIMKEQSRQMRMLEDRLEQLERMLE